MNLFDDNKEFTTEQKIDILNRILEINALRGQFNGCLKAPNFVYDDRLHFNVEQIGRDGTARVYTKDFSVNQLSRPMREAVVPAPGKKFLYFDFSAAELYIMAYWSQATELLNWFKNGYDVHTEIMKRLLNREEVSKADREISKVLSFATIYGGNESTIARDLKCDILTAMKFQEDYAKLFPEINIFKAKWVRKAHECGYTETIFGRRRLLPALNSYDEYEVAHAERQTVNTAIQGSCADFLKEGTNRIFNKHKDVKVKFQVFDSMLVEVPESYTEEDALKIVDTATNFDDIFPGFKFSCKWAFGSNWKECQDRT